MSDEITSPRRKRRPVRTALTVIALIGIGFIALSVLGNFLSEGGWIGGDKVAVIRIEGIILDSRETIEELRHYRDNPSVKAIVLRIDSPGGAVVPSQEIFAEDRKSRGEWKINEVKIRGIMADVGGDTLWAVSDIVV